MNLTKLSILLKNLRKNNNYTTKQVEILSNNTISNSYISLIENNKRKPSAKILKILSNIYNYDYLLLYKLAGYIDTSNLTLEESSETFLNNNNMLDITGISKQDKKLLLNLIKSMKSKNKVDK